MYFSMGTNLDGTNFIAVIDVIDIKYGNGDKMKMWYWTIIQGYLCSNKKLKTKIIYRNSWITNNILKMKIVYLNLNKMQACLN